MKHLIPLLAGVCLTGAFLFTGSISAHAEISAEHTILYNQSSVNDTLSDDQASITVSAANESDIAADLNDALKTARDLADSTGNIVTVKVPAGNYTLSSGLHIYSNTTLELTGVTLTFAGSKPFNMIISGTMGTYKDVSPYNTSSLCSGYNGFKNITINGGTLVSTKDNDCSIVRLFHATNVKINGLTIKGGACTHQMEVCAINGFYVTNCTFQDNGKSITDVDNDENQEALQLDIPCKTDVYPDVYEDGTTMKNVEITGCTFKNVARGVGTHTLLVGAYHENMKINNNTFDNVVEECILAQSYYNCEIKNNTIKNCVGGILVQNFKATANSMNTTIFDGKTSYSGEFLYNLKTTVSGNKITLRYAPTCADAVGVKVVGYKLNKAITGGDGKKIPAGNYYITGVTVTNNTITTAGHGIYLGDARNCTVSNNTITGKNFSSDDPLKNSRDGIFVENYAKNNIVTNNSVTSMSRNGILIQHSSSVKEITGNTIKNCKGNGVQIYDKSSCTSDFSNNIIKKCKQGGILVSTNSSTAAISKNKLSSCSGDAAITIYKSSTTGVIHQNTIKATGKGSDKTLQPAIKLTTGSTSGSISKNKILAGSASYSSGRGILIYKSSKVKGSIKSNIIEKCQESGIVLSESSKVSGSLSNNTITNTGKYGICILSGSTIGKSIISNTIKKAKTCGINISSVKNKLTIEKNTISGSSNAGIYLQPASVKYKITVKGNTITGNKKGPGLTIREANVTITNNKISKVTFGVYADAASKGRIYKNKISKVSKKKIYTASKKVKLK